jgi:hypothetical protein
MRFPLFERTVVPTHKVFFLDYLVLENYGDMFFQNIRYQTLCSVDRASLHNLVNEPNLVHNILSMFCQFFYNLYMFQTSPVPSSGGIILFIPFVVFCYFA